jgi:hypothetical protein
VNVLERLALRVRWGILGSVTSRHRERHYRLQYGYEIANLSRVVVLLAVVAIVLGALLGMRVTTTHPAATTPHQLPAPPSAIADARLREAFARLSTARSGGRHNLATAKSPSAQAVAALVLREANLRAAADLGGDHKGVADALRRTAAAYGALAAAAQERDAKAFARASSAVDGAERQLEDLVGNRS